MCETSSCPWSTVKGPVWSWLRQMTFPSGRRGRWEVRAPLQGPRGRMVICSSLCDFTRQEMFSRNWRFPFSAMFRRYYVLYSTHTWHDMIWCSITMHDNSMHYNAMHYNAMHYNATHYNAMHYTYTTVQYTTVQYNTIHYNTLQYYTTIHYNTLEYTAYIFRCL